LSLSAPVMKGHGGGRDDGCIAPTRECQYVGATQGQAIGKIASTITVPVMKGQMRLAQMKGVACGGWGIFAR
jgi:hypothetical protein